MLRRLAQRVPFRLPRLLGGGARAVPFELNTNDFHFDTEIIIQFLLARHADRGAADPDLLRRRDLPRQRHQVRLGRDEGGAGRALAAAGPLLRPAVRCRAGSRGNAQYEPKLDYPSPHTAALELVPAGARVLDLGCAGGYVGAMLRRRRGCRVTGVDKSSAGTGRRAGRVRRCTTSTTASRRSTAADFDYVLLLDVIEHLASPEDFIEQLRERAEARAGDEAARRAPRTSASSSTA